MMGPGMFDGIPKALGCMAAAIIFAALAVGALAGWLLAR